MKRLAVVLFGFVATAGTSTSCLAAQTTVLRETPTALDAGFRHICHDWFRRTQASLPHGSRVYAYDMVRLRGGSEVRTVPNGSSVVRTRDALFVTDLVSQQTIRMPLDTRTDGLTGCASPVVLPGRRLDSVVKRLLDHHQAVFVRTI